MTSLADSDWFAGFTDGEGSFQFHTDNRQPRCPHVPVFGITLRADDVAILEGLREAFGGSLNNRSVPSPGRPNPIAEWKVGSKRDLAGLVRYFDAHPLRAKKARDYVIWRRLVTAYLRGGRVDPEIPALIEALRAVRAYDAGDLAEVIEHPQLRLVDEL